MKTARTTSTSSHITPTSAIDPVCGMSVQTDPAAARLEFAGQL